MKESTIIKSTRKLMRHIVIIAMVACLAPLSGKSQTNEFEKHANIIYLITRYFEWPASVQYGNFVIGIYGDVNAFETFDRMIVYKKVGNQNIKIRKVTDYDQMNGCHLIFVANVNTVALDKIISLTKKTSTIVITQETNYLSKGSCLNFKVENDKLKIELNSAEILKRNIKIDSELLSLLENK